MMGKHTPIWLPAILDGSPLYFAVVRGTDHEIEFANSRFTRLGNPTPLWAAVDEWLQAPNENSNAEIRFGELTIDFRFQLHDNASVVIAGVDVSDAVKVREHLKLLSQAVEQSPVSVVMTDERANIVYVNPKFTSLTGYSYGEVVGKNPRILQSGKATPEFYQELWGTLQAGQIWTGNFRNQKKDGTFFFESAKIAPVMDGNGVITNYIAVKEDVTYAHELEERLREGERLEAIGTLAGGVAHDFNNLLTTILGNLAFISARDDLDESLRADTEEIRSAAERAQQLTRDLLAFGRKQMLTAANLDLPKLVMDFVPTLQTSVGNAIEIEVEPAAQLWPVCADGRQVRKVMESLIANARDTMPGGGKIRIAFLNVSSAAVASATESQAADFVSMEIRDNGTGISPEDLPHIFEPFYSTKGVGAGTGLGLATVYGIVKQSGGCVDVSSNREGTTVRLSFPRATGAARSELPTGVNPNPGAHGKVLVVEDQPSVRRLAARILKGQGYEVLEAENGELALTVLADTSEPVDLLLTDLVMPNMGGHRLAEIFSQRFPATPIILMSGYSEESASGVVLPGNVRGFLEKPFTPESLRENVARALATC